MTSYIITWPWHGTGTLVVAWNLAHQNKGTSRRKEEQFLPIRMPTVCWKTRPRNITNMLSIKKSSMLISVSERHSIQRNLPSHCAYVINYSYSYPCSEYSINTAHLILQNNHHSLIDLPNILLYIHGLVILVVNIASILLTWCYIPIIHSLIDLPNILTVPTCTWFSYRCSEYSINTAHLMLHTNHSVTHRLTQHSYCTYMV